MRHVHLQRLGRGRPRSLSPQLIDQTIARDTLAAAQHQDRKQRPLLRGAERNRPLPLDHLERPQDAEVKHDLLVTPGATLLRQGVARRAPPPRVARRGPPPTRPYLLPTASYR